jgi:hypothetical protein
MNQKELRELASQIKKANNAVKQAILAIGDYQKLKPNNYLDEDIIQKLVPLLKNYYDDIEDFESPCGFYHADIQQFEEDVRILESAIKSTFPK